MLKKKKKQKKKKKKKKRETERERERKKKKTETQGQSLKTNVRLSQKVQVLFSVRKIKYGNGEKKHPDVNRIFLFLCIK